jgi:ADP-ribosylglycohydrolase
MNKIDYCEKFHPGGIADKIAGLIFGHALGDALGLITEFQEKIPLDITFPYTESIRGTPPCDWTDDTDLLIVSMISLMENNMVFSPNDIAARFKHWAENGLTVVGDKAPSTPNNMFKLIVSQQDYVKNPLEVAEKVTKSASGNSCGNSPLSRIAITATIGILETTVGFCSMTHPDSRCVASCVFFTTVLNEFLYSNISSVKDLDRTVALAEEISIGVLASAHHDEFKILIAQKNTLKSLRLGEISKSSHIYKCLSCIVYCVNVIRVAITHNKRPSWKKTITKIVLEGGDADANASVAGALLGAFWGKSYLPSDWVFSMPNSWQFSQFIASYISKLMRPTTIEENAEAAGESIDSIVAAITGESVGSCAETVGSGESKVSTDVAATAPAITLTATTDTVD